MKIADILERAVNHLPKEDGYSCWAIEDAITCANAFVLIDEDIYAGLANMGLDPDSSSEFNDVPYGPRRQYARALWLTWAAMMAREQGV